MQIRIEVTDFERVAYRVPIQGLTSILNCIGPILFVIAETGEVPRSLPSI